MCTAIPHRFDSSAVPQWYKLLRAQGRDEAHQVAAELAKELAWLEGQLDAQGGSGWWWGAWWLSAWQERWELCVPRMIREGERQ